MSTSAEAPSCAQSLIPSDGGECGVYAVIKECFADELVIDTLRTQTASTDRDPAVFVDLVGGDATLTIWLNEPYAVQSIGNWYAYSTLGELEHAIHEALEDVYLRNASVHDALRGLDTTEHLVEETEFAPLALPLLEERLCSGCCLEPSRQMISALHETVLAIGAHYSAANALSN